MAGTSRMVKRYDSLIRVAKSATSMPAKERMTTRTQLSPRSSLSPLSDAPPRSHLPPRQSTTLRT